MKALFVTSDQVENTTAIAGVSERDLCRPVGVAAAERMSLHGWEGRQHDPAKHFDVLTALQWNPDVVVFIHCDSTGHTAPQGVMGVEDSLHRETAWAKDMVARVADGLGFGVWGVSTDMDMRSFRYWFFRQCDGYKAHRLVLELVNMGNLEQATYVRDHPDLVGMLIADAVHETLSVEVDDMAIDTVSDATVEPQLAVLKAAGIVNRPEDHPFGDAASVGLVFTMMGRMQAEIDALKAAPGK